MFTLFTETGNENVSRLWPYPYLFLCFLVFPVLLCLSVFLFVCVCGRGPPFLDLLVPCSAPPTHLSVICLLPHSSAHLSPRPHQPPTIYVCPLPFVLCRFVTHSFAMCCILSLCSRVPDPVCSACLFCMPVYLPVSHLLK